MRQCALPVHLGEPLIAWWGSLGADFLNCVCNDGSRSWRKPPLRSGIAKASLALYRSACRR